MNAAQALVDLRQEHTIVHNPTQARRILEAGTAFYRRDSIFEAVEITRRDAMKAVVDKGALERSFHDSLFPQVRYGAGSQTFQVQSPDGTLYECEPDEESSK